MLPLRPKALKQRKNKIIMSITAAVFNRCAAVCVFMENVHLFVYYALIFLFTFPMNSGRIVSRTNVRKMEGAVMKQYSERVYVKVNTDFDSTGYMMPRSIIWSDGRVFTIDAVRDFRPASALEKGRSGDCYTVVIRGEERLLFFEKTCELFASRVGRWFVEKSITVRR